MNNPNSANSAQLNPIAVLNDRLRCQGDKTLGKYKMTVGVSALSPTELTDLLKLVQNFNQFDKNNDPYGEHDFGSFTFKEEKYCFKIDYYDLSEKYASEDPSNPAVTIRVLLIMRMDEY